MRINRHAASGIVLTTMVIATACANETTAPVGHRGLLRSQPVASLVTTTVVVKPSSPNGWAFFDDNGQGGSGAFVVGPASAPLGTGSAQVAITASNQGYAIGAAIMQGTALSTITALQYSGLRQSADAGNNLALSLQINVDYDLTDATNSWQGRLVFEPYHLGGSGSVIEDTWQTWDATGGATGGWFSTGNPVVANVVGVKACTMAAPCTWAQVLALYPNIGVHGTFGAILFKAGSGWTAFTGNLDRFVVGTAALETTYDFEPAFGSCAVNDNGSTYTLLSNCTTNQTLVLPNGYTLDGNGFTITAVDPPGAGAHFLGAVVRNGGATAHVTDVTITASGLANVCDGAGPPDNRLRGILFEGASGSITNNTVTNVNQGPSGCQEGNAIEARNAPFDNTGSDVVVTIDGNAVNGYIKNGITANGSVAATISNNVVTGSGPVGVPLAAQNGIQVGFGATAVIKGNTISGNNYTPASWLACGVLLYLADGVKASQNAMTGNERDMCNFGKGGGNFNPNP